MGGRQRYGLHLRPRRQCQCGIKTTSGRDIARSNVQPMGSRLFKEAPHARNARAADDGSVGWRAVRRTRDRNAPGGDYGDSSASSLIRDTPKIKSQNDARVRGRAGSASGSPRSGRREPNGPSGVWRWLGRALLSTDCQGSATEYRRNAEDCLRLANRASPETRAILIMMAQAWLRLAQQREGAAVEREAPVT